MAKNRKAAQDFILKYIEKITPKSGNRQFYENRFSQMNDKEFDQFMSDLESGKQKLFLTEPNFKDTITVENNLEIAKELGHDFFQQLWIKGKKGFPDHLTPIKYMVVDLPVRRASQILTKKISVPKNQKVIDALTGQPTGESKGAKISYPELQVLAAMGMESSLVELMKYRGGDNKGHVAYNAMLSKYGRANLDSLKNYSSGVESTTTLKTFLTAAHLKNTL